MPTALITGASQGFGRALLAALVAQGWTCVVDARDARALHEAAAALPAVRAVPGDVTDPGHRAAWWPPPDGRVDLLVHNASALGPHRCRGWPTYPLDALRRRLRGQRARPARRSPSSRCPHCTRRPAPTVVVLSSDAAVEAYPGWGGYGSAKAALDHLAAVLAVEHPELRVYAFDPGDMRTAMHQAAFPGEDISDRAEPETVVPALLHLLARTSRQRPLPRRRPAHARPYEPRPATRPHPLHPAARPRRDRTTRAARAGARRGAAAGRRGGQARPAHHRSATSPSSCEPGDLIVVNTSATRACRGRRRPRRRTAGHGARLPPGTERRRLDRRVAHARRRRTDPRRACRGTRPPARAG